MKKVRGSIIPATLTASALLGIIASMSFLLMSNDETAARASLSLTPNAAVVNTDGIVQVEVTVTSDTAVNAFGGMVVFDESVLTVERIDYNTSIADLWAKAPWYDKGAGTISFGGGTTKPGGFVGSGALLTVTFKARSAGQATVSLRDIQVLKHDGFGTPIHTDTEIDSLLTVTAPLETTTEAKTLVVVRDERATGDLTGDGIVSLKDASVLFGYIATGDPRGDIDGDGRVSLRDMSVLMSHF